MDVTDRIGCWLVPAGAFFRVWAPHASQVQVVVQTAERWDSGRSGTVGAMTRTSGYWSVTLPRVRPGDLYRFRITTAGGEVLDRLDPAARDVLSSELTRDDPDSHNASIVSTADDFDWAPFEPPRFENFVIYQLHVGTFAGRGDDRAKEWATFADVERKFGYARDLGFTAVQPLPVQEYAMDRSWGYNPASFFAPESSYGSPADLRRFVDAAHRTGLAVIFDVVHNHFGHSDNVLWDYDGYRENGGIYVEGGRQTPWGPGPAWWKEEVQDFFYRNARMYLEEYHADGLRFDATTQIDGQHLRRVVERLRAEFPDRYLIAEHLPDHPWIVKEGGFDATWCADAHHEAQRALAGQDPVRRIKGILGWDGYDHAWNLVKYLLGSHDDIGDQQEGNAEDGLTDWDRRHRYLIDQLGGRDDWTARAKCRVAWALNATMPGTPMLFMGSECLQAAPHVAWGYWHDGHDGHGDHRFDWSIAGDALGVQLRRLVGAANRVRFANPALRADSLDITHEDHDNQVLAFVRQSGDNVVLVVVNLGDESFGDHGYGVRTGDRGGRWTQVLCTQDADFGGWDGAGNAFHDAWTQPDGRVYVNVPKWSVVALRRA
ncbi:alpha-amylase family glycosyl hydrolase [Asanoa sp. NPDC049518]|uniref:alpha-amylase family glycosyl hydrolase n=1 Tax=unclassified Asanoa TaxID=2685164 RepID=UPI003442AC5E